jgi:hypothetical protein
MTSNIDIYQTANELIKQHSEDAPIHAAMRADELLDAGDMDGQAVWKQILAAVDELLSDDRPGGGRLTSVAGLERSAFGGKADINHYVA